MASEAVIHESRTAPASEMLVIDHIQLPSTSSLSSDTSDSDTSSSMSSDSIPMAPPRAAQVPSATFVTEIDEKSIRRDPTKRKTDAIDIAVDQLLERGTAPAQPLRLSVIQRLNRRKLACLMNSDYRGAEQCENALASLAKTDDANRVFAAQERCRTSLAERRDALLAERARINEECDARVNQEEERCDARYDALVRAHAAQVEAFKAKWQDPEFLKQFGRPSQRLVSLRHMEKQMALARRYDDARRTKKLADKQQVDEEAVAQSQVEAAMKKEFVKMRERQRKEMDRVASRTESAKTEIERQRTLKLAAIDVAVKQLSDDRKMRLSKSGPIVKRDENGRWSPRTQSRMARFRDAAAGELNIAPVDDTTFDRIIANSRKKKKRSHLPSL